MNVIPNTKVRLLTDVPFFQTYEHVRQFDNETEQTNYFLSKTAQVFTDFTYQREEVAVKVPIGYDKLYSYNYLMYQNTEFGGKWFYAFITKKEYVNPECTRIYFELDVYQTWQTRLEWKPSFIAREHRTRWNVDGTPVINTLDEGLNYGTEYNIVHAEQYQPSNGLYYLVVACKKAMHEGMDDTYYASVNGLPQLIVYYVQPFFLTGGTVTTNQGLVSAVEDFLAVLYTQSSAVNNVISIYVTDMLPNNPIYANGSVAFPSDNFELVTLAGKLNDVSIQTMFVTDSTYGSWSYVVGDKYDNYNEVTESKLLMYPYTLVELVDLRGHKVTYKNEYIASDSLQITILGSLGLNQKTTYTLKDYLTGALADDIDKYKVNQETALINNDPNDLPIFTDLLGAFLQGNRNTLQNQKNQWAFHGISNMANSIANRDVGGLVSNAGNSYFQIAGLNAKLADIQNTPPQLSHMGSNVYFDYGNRLTGVWIVKKQITPEYQKRLTDFFFMYGYKVNELKMPNLKTRSSFNYVQTVGANISGDIPQDAITQLKTIFNTGVTLWHGDYIGDYARENDEI